MGAHLPIAAEAQARRHRQNRVLSIHMPMHSDCEQRAAICSTSRPHRSSCRGKKGSCGCGLALVAWQTGPQQGQEARHLQRCCASTSAADALQLKVMPALPCSAVVLIWRTCQRAQKCSLILTPGRPMPECPQSALAVARLLLALRTTPSFSAVSLTVSGFTYCGATSLPACFLPPRNTLRRPEASKAEAQVVT